MKKVSLALSILFLTLISSVVFAHEPVRELTTDSQAKGAVLHLESAFELKDPTEQSLAVYGRIGSPNEVDLYKIQPSTAGPIPVEVLVPVRASNEAFRPSFAFISKCETEEVVDNQIIVPDGYCVTFVDVTGEREVFFEPFSLEKLYHGNETEFFVQGGELYYIAVFEPDGYMGDYSLGIGTVEKFEDVSFFGLLKEVLLIKLGVVGGTPIPWLDLLGLFLFIAGFVIGLGAVTVIDLHGFLGRTSKYWTEATIRTHKITKPLIWLGTFLATMGGLIYYRMSGVSSTATFHFILLGVLVLNGLYLTFKISPYLLHQEKSKTPDKLLPKMMQRRIVLSFMISFFGWWGSLFLLVWHILILR